MRTLPCEKNSVGTGDLSGKRRVEWVRRLRHTAQNKDSSGVAPREKLYSFLTFTTQELMPRPHRPIRNAKKAQGGRSTLGIRGSSEPYRSDTLRHFPEKEILA